MTAASTPEELLRCRNAACLPRVRSRDGADHHGVDVYVRCLICDARSPYREAEKQADVRDAVIASWNAGERDPSYPGDRP